jgi:fructose-bisphosphate aldolase class II
MQWAFSAGIRDYYKEFNDYVQTQIGNPDGEDLPNKKYYDPRRVLRQAEESFITRLEESFADLNCLNRN